MNDKFEFFSQELLRWNKTHNLTGYRTKELIYRNILDSIYPLNFINDFEDAIDIGSGNGFPSIILAIEKKGSFFKLVEPNNKKYAFLNYIAMTLKLDNVEIIKSRIEDLQSNKVDLITSRALYPSDKILKLAINFLKNNGYCLLYKGSSESNATIKNGSRSYIYKPKGEI